jgi:hypothetical protein
MSVAIIAYYNGGAEAEFLREYAEAQHYYETAWQLIRYAKTKVPLEHIKKKIERGLSLMNMKVRNRVELPKTCPTRLPPLAL